MSALILQHSNIPSHQTAQVDRINHSSPNKGPGGSSIGFAGGNSVNGAGMNMVGS